MGTPSVVSDLAVFRWSLGDAALYADPYNIPAISEAVELLLNTPENAERREAIRQKAAGILDRFSIDTISRQWAAFFEEDMERLFKKPAPYLQG